MAYGSGFACVLVVSCGCVVVHLDFVVVVYGVWVWLRLCSRGFVWLRDDISWVRGGCVWCLGWFRLCFCVLLASYACVMVHHLGIVVLAYGVWVWLRLCSRGFVWLHDSISWFRGGCVW